MTKSLTYNATIVERTNLTDALSIFRIQPDKPPGRPWFTAGQYCVIGLNNAAHPELGPVRRPMSIASAPESDGPVEFYIRRVATPDSRNPLTALLWSIPSGGRVYLRTTAAGVFTFKDTIGADDTRMRVLVAAGTGLAPFMSMIRSEVCRDPHADLSNWVLLHGASYPRELGYSAELRRVSAANRLNYWPTVSRPAEAPDWNGDVGRVEAFFEPARLADLEKRLGLPSNGFTPATMAIYICGLTGTIGETILRLRERGFVPDDERVRRALHLPASATASIFCEHYDATHAVPVPL
jgi:ferredoxin--NADP+ reductase